MQFSGWSPFPVRVLSSDLQPTSERSGLHLSQVLERIGKAIGEEYSKDDDPSVRFTAGFVFETAQVEDQPAKLFFAEFGEGPSEFAGRVPTESRHAEIGDFPL